MWYHISKCDITFLLEGCLLLTNDMGASQNQQFQKIFLTTQNCLGGCVAAKLGNSGGFESSCPVKLKTCGFETTKTTPESRNFGGIDSSCLVK